MYLSKEEPPRLNGKVEQSLRFDERERYYLLDHKDIVDFERTMETWGNFYNFHSPHGARVEKHTMKF